MRMGTLCVLQAIGDFSNRITPRTVDVVGRIGQRYALLVGIAALRVAWRKLALSLVRLAIPMVWALLPIRTANGVPRNRGTLRVPLRIASDSHGLASIARYDWRCRWQNRATLRVACGNCNPTGCLEKANAFSCSICDSHGLALLPIRTANGVPRSA